MDGVFVAPCAFGRGLFAARRYAAGERVLRFVGPEREDPRDGSREESNLVQIGLDRYLFPDEPWVYVNHSCLPNTAFRDDAVTLYAIAPIERGEELFFDYSTSILRDPWTMGCGCGHADCRGIIGEFPALPPSVQRRYLERGHVPSFVRDHLGFAPGGEAFKRRAS
ncbi:MAG: hypothetical protein CVU56_08575 [Deltaproteobacteria bacterium HGW-Deltaproteobacteria-14]|nr:MAG: hypothetical protein CVU56_08575 [Deltaproteobacteria bacterium HGW-Deltaproteobacteria-14]